MSSAWFQFIAIDKLVWDLGPLDYNINFLVDLTFRIHKLLFWSQVLVFDFKIHKFLNEHDTIRRRAEVFLWKIILQQCTHPPTIWMQDKFIWMQMVLSSRKFSSVLAVWTRASSGRTCYVGSRMSVTYPSHNLLVSVSFFP